MRTAAWRGPSLTRRPRAPSWARATTRRSRSPSRPPTRPITRRPPPRRRSTSLQATPTITWANPADIVYGTALGGRSSTPARPGRSAGNGSVAGTFTYTPAAGTVLDAGNNQTLSVTFTPTDTTDYTTATATATINVLQATPTITWANPADIVYGTALSGTQLDASSSWTVGGVSGAWRGRSLTPRPRAPSWTPATTRRSRSPSRPPTRPITPRPPPRRRSTSCRRRRRSAGPIRRTSSTARR